MKHLSALIIFFLCCAMLSAQTTRDGITIPADGTHPFTYWNSSRLATAQAWAAAVHYTPPATKSLPLDPDSMAFGCYVMGKSSACSGLVSWALAAPLGTCTGVGDDPLRDNGSGVYLAYDWAYSQFTPNQLSTLNSDWISCQFQQDNNSAQWGLYGANGTKAMQPNNYFHGDWRNDNMFGLTMYYDNPGAAEEMLDVGIGGQGGAWNASRLNSFESYAAGAGYGVPFLEGPGEYGRYGQFYAAYWVPSFHLLGRNINDQTNAFQASVLVNIYDSVYVNSYRGCQEYIAWGDDDNWAMGCPSYYGSSQNGYANYHQWTMSRAMSLMQSEYYGDFMQMMVNEIPTTNIGRYARQWLNTVQPGVGPSFASLDPNPAPLSFATLPLDYCSAAGMCWTNATDWFTTGSERAWYLGNSTKQGNANHTHAEAGNFQIWRKGTPIVRETTGYAEQVAGLGGNGTVPLSSAFAHNVLLFNGFGSNTNNDLSVQGFSTILGLESQTNYFYQADDLTAVYTSGQKHTTSNLSVSQYIREFINFRGIPGVVTLDRATAATSTTPITYLGHCETVPTVSASGNYSYVDCIDHGQQARWTFLAPANPSIAIIDESANGATCQTCQFRIEATNSDPGNTLSYFLVFVQVGDAGNWTPLSPSLVDSNPSNPASGTFTVTLDANDMLLINKGGSVTGGTIEAGGVINNLATTVEPFTVGENGPLWGPAQ